MNTVEPDRMMAQIVRIEKISPIEKADKIELATVLGWNVVTKKDEFKIDDLAIYFTIGSILDPDNADVKFLNNKPLKTKRILGIISQGLLGPLSWLNYYGIESKDFKEGDDVTTQMKVKKFV